MQASITQTTLIAFIGRKGSGKDTAANFATDAFGRLGEPTLTAYFNFASVLRDITLNTLNLSNQQYEFLKRNPEVNVANNLDVRSFMNKLGDNLKRYFGKYVFTEITVERIKDTLVEVNPDLMLVTDVRYPHELAALKKLCEDKGIEFVSIKMINENLQDEICLDGTEHESEYQVDDIHGQFVIKAKDIEEIKKKMEVICNELC